MPLSKGLKLEFRDLMQRLGLPQSIAHSSNLSRQTQIVNDSHSSDRDRDLTRANRPSAEDAIRDGIALAKAVALVEMGQ